MKFQLVALETWPHSNAQEIALMACAKEGIDGPLPAQAAKRVSELGGRGVCILEDQNGTRSAWRLHVAQIHYVYPIVVPYLDAVP